MEFSGRKTGDGEAGFSFVRRDDIDRRLVGEFHTSGELDERFDRIE